MLTNVASSIFTDSNSIEMLPVVSAEWNQNLFSSPYFTVAGTGVAETSVALTSGTVSSVTGTSANPNFTTKSFATTSGAGSISYTVTTSSAANAYKIITYVKTSELSPSQLSSYAKGSTYQFGSTSEEVNSLGWTKIITYIGSSGTLDAISSFVYTLSVNNFASNNASPTVYYTVPEIYPTTFFDYQYSSMWPTDSVFQHFRPGESYVTTGDANYASPANYRRITNIQLNGYTTTTYSPISSIIQTPSFVFATPPVPVLKNALASEMAPYKYFVSDNISKSITAIYEQNINSNKIVIKFNSIMTTPTINVLLGGNILTVDGSTSITPDANGLLVLYWTGTAWTKTKWSETPKFDSLGILTKYTSFKKITVTQISKVNKTDFSSYTNTNVVSDLNRMQLIEVSPRLEIDLTNFVQNLSINKSLDSKNNAVPISSINSNDASFTLSGIPAMNGTSIVPIFSSQSNLASTILSQMLRKNIKFYVNFNLKSYAKSSNNSYTQVNGSTGTYIPGGIFYSDSWSERDISQIDVQCYDITRYLQSTPAPDYVSNLKSVFDIITTMLDMSGFTDYDYDSLYNVCNDKVAPIELFYYYCNSKNITIAEALAQVFLSYQIGAHIDEYGIMKFLSLSNILDPLLASSISIYDSSIKQSGYSVSNKAKPGKISLRYQTPKIKQTKSANSLIHSGVKKSPSFIYTTSNDVVWEQTTVDSVGFNYLNASMAEKDNYFKLDVNDALDNFHSYDIANKGYAAIENEIVSFVYKQYKITNIAGGNEVLVNIKNDVELQSEINKYVKKYKTGLIVSTLDVNGDVVTPTGDYDIVVTATGIISNVQRGMFGTVPANHTIITDLPQKGLSQATINSSYSISTGGSNATVTTNKRIQISAPASSKVLIYPTSSTDNSYKTHSTKFYFNTTSVAAAGLCFNISGTSSANNGYFVELIKTNTQNTNVTPNVFYSPARYSYMMAIYQINSGTENVLAWADVTSIAEKIIYNFSRVMTKTGTPGNYIYTVSQDESFNLKAVHYTSDGSEGETAGEVLSVFLNNFEIVNWQVPNLTTGDLKTGWKDIALNKKTYTAKKISLPSAVSTGTIFGSYMSTKPVVISGITYPSSTTATAGTVREIHATQKPLKERSVSYYFQDRDFLNAMVQGQKTFSKIKSYLMQTKPEISGINMYDVPYTLPAAVTVDIHPVYYTMFYWPGENAEDQNEYLTKSVDEYALAYSTPINTGYRAKFAIANNSNHSVFLARVSDVNEAATVKFTLYAQEILAPSDAEVIEKIVDYSNSSEVAQIDSEWIQSKESAYKILSLIEKGMDGFSKDTALEVFGNPLIQVGDVVTLTYYLTGINQQKYVVHSVSHSFSDGLTTRLVLNKISSGTAVAVASIVVVGPYWISIYNAVARGRSIISDSENNIYVFGYTDNSIKYPTLIKYQKDGTLLWQKKINVSYDSYGMDIKINNNGDILLAGISGNGTTQDSFIISVNSSGSLNWQRKINTTLDIPSNYYLVKYPNIGFDASSNVYLSITKNSSPDYIEILKYNSSGVLQWQNKLTAPGYATYSKIAVDSNNNKYLVSTANNASAYTSQLHIVKYDSTDTVVWQKKLEHAGFYSGAINPSSVNFDLNGNIYITADVGDNSLQAAALFKYNSSGILQWSKSIVSSDISYATQIDLSGNVYWIIHQNLAYPIIYKMDSSGNTIFQKRLSCVYNGPNGSATPAVYDITIDSQGDLLLSGRLDVTDASYSDVEFIIKLPPDGSLTGTYAVPLNNQSASTVNVTYEDTSLSTSVVSYTEGNGFLTISAGDLTDSAGSFTISNTTEIITKRDIP
jgi:hypothetical protein